MALEKEDLTHAKTHFKNCLFLQESNSLVLIHYAVILMTEGKTHEAKFYISRILSALEPQVEQLMEILQKNYEAEMKSSGGSIQKLKTGISLPPKNANRKKSNSNSYSKWNRKRSKSREKLKHDEMEKNKQLHDHHLLSDESSEEDMDPALPYADRVEHWELQQWLEELLIRVFHGDYLATGATLTNDDVYPSLGDLDVIGHSGAEHGMTLNQIKSDAKTYNILETFQMFSNLYDWLADGEMTGRFVFDIGQSLYESGKTELGHSMMRRGHLTANPSVEGYVSVEVVKIRLALDCPVIPNSIAQVVESYLNMTEYLSRSSLTFAPIDIENIMDIYWPLPLLAFSGLFPGPILLELMYRFEGGSIRKDSQSMLWLADALSVDLKSDMHTPVVDGKQTEENDGESLLQLGIEHDMGEYVESEVEGQNERVEIGIFGGHFNSHPVGLMVLYRLLALDKSKFRITLIATPLNADHVTRDIASRVDEIVNIPMSTEKAWSIIESKLHLVSSVFSCNHIYVVYCIPLHCICLGYHFIS